MSSAEMASGYVKRMVETECRGWGDQENALARLEQKYGVPFWTLNNLRTGRAKTVEAGIFHRIRAAYLDICEKQMARLQHELSIEKAMYSDDSIEDLEREARQLSAKIAQAKAKARLAKTAR